MITTQDRMMGKPLPLKEREQLRLRRVAERKEVTLAYWFALKAAPTQQVQQEVKDQYEAFVELEKAVGPLSDNAVAHELRVLRGYAAGVYRKVDGQLTLRKN